MVMLMNTYKSVLLPHNASICVGRKGDCTLVEKNSYYSDLFQLYHHAEMWGRQGHA